MSARAQDDGVFHALSGPLRMFGGLKAHGRLPREQILGRLAYSLKQPLFALPFYSVTLAGRGPMALLVSPSDPWPGDAAAGAEICQGVFTLRGRSLRHPAPLWAPVGASRSWCEAINDFHWLRDLRAAGGDAPRRAARDLVNAWIDANQRWDPLSWGPAVTGRRLAHWLGHYEFFAASADVAFRHRFLTAISRQARHLARVLPAGLNGIEAIAAIKGLVYAGACVPGAEAQLNRGLELLGHELPRQILADGGHAARSPAVQLDVLRDLVDLRALLVAGEIEVPPDLQAAIAQMAPVLRLFQHGDGGLAQFNGSDEAEGWQVDMVVQRAGARTRLLKSAPACGFQRLQANRTLVLVDAGPPPRPGYDRDAHAGFLSFEMSVGRQRLIVNCGARPGDGDWNQVQRATAAHSTLVVGDTNTAELRPEGGFGRVPESVTCRRDEADGDHWLDLAHDGYRNAFGLGHRRRLYLSGAGDNLRGEDRLSGPAGHEFAVRFHLHPAVQAGLSQGGDTALLRLPKGAGWRLRAQGAALRLEPSVYLGHADAVRRSQQIVLSGTTAEGETLVKWALQREGQSRAGR